MALTREAVVREALALLNEVGFDGLTVRRLAERLDIQNPALYWHFKNKQDLLDQMAATMISDGFAGIKPPATQEDWRAWLAEVAARFHHTLLTYCDGARVVAAADLTKSELLAIQEMALSVLTSAGFDLHTALVSVVAMLDYTLGATFEEQAELAPIRRFRSNELGSSRALLDSGRLPLLAAALDEVGSSVSDDLSLGFAGGLHLMLTGMIALKRPVE